jgi:hypothetical protein
LSALSKIFELAILERITMENPVRLVKKFKEDNERVRYFKPDEEEGLEEVIDFAPSYLKSFVILTRHTGVRSGEAQPEDRSGRSSRADHPPHQNQGGEISPCSAE